MNIFRPSVNFEHLLCEVVATGGAFVAEALTLEYLDYLSEELDSLQYGEYSSASEAAVYERHRDFRAQIYSTKANIPRLSALCEYVGWRVRSASMIRANTHLFYPDDVNVWRYSDNTSAIGVHRDYSHDKLLIVGITVAGYSLLEFYGKNKDNPRPKQWHTGPGSLMLLRAPSLCANDSRPYHQVHPPKHGERVSVIIRQDERNSLLDSGKEY